MPVLPRQVELAETMLRAEGGAVAGLSAVSRIQLFPGDLCYSSGAAADSGTAHRHQAAAVWVLEMMWHHLNKYVALLAFAWGDGVCSICGPGLLCLFPKAIKIQCPLFCLCLRQISDFFLTVIWGQQTLKPILYNCLMFGIHIFIISLSLSLNNAEWFTCMKSLVLRTITWFIHVK